jgi:hypothetical protein
LPAALWVSTGCSVALSVTPWTPERIAFEDELLALLEPFPAEWGSSKGSRFTSAARSKARAPCNTPARLGGGDPLHLPFSAEIGLELGERRIDMAITRLTGDA